MTCSHTGDGVQHAPAVAMELRKGVQVHISIADTHVPSKHHRVCPQIAVGQLNTLGAGGGAAGVVDRCGGVFVVVPWCWVDIKGHQLVVTIGADGEGHLAFHVGESVGQFGVDEENACPTVFHDVFHFFSDESEVHRNEDAAGPRHPK